MAACGLAAGSSNFHTFDRRLSIVEDERPKEHVAVTMLKFATEMMKKLQNLNSGVLDFKLRIGKCLLYVEKKEMKEHQALMLGALFGQKILASCTPTEKRGFK